MKKYISLFVAFVSVTLIISCNKKPFTDNFINTDNIPEFTVDELMKSPQSYVDSIIKVEGRCIHICRMTGNSMYLVFENDSTMLRCLAAAPISGAFSDTIKGRVMKFSGMLREERLTKEGVADLRDQYASHMQLIPSKEIADSAMYLRNRRCKYERHYREQDSIVGFDEEMKDYEQRIDYQTKYEGKPYLSFYYLETIKVEE